MTSESDPAIHPDVMKLIEDITEMADQIRQPFVPDPDKVRIFNTAYIDSVERAAAWARSQKPHPAR